MIEYNYADVKIVLKIIHKVHYHFITGTITMKRIRNVLTIN